jgi:hypothetical protein
MVHAHRLLACVEPVTYIDGALLVRVMRVSRSCSIDVTSLPRSSSLPTHRSVLLYWHTV